MEDPEVVRRQPFGDNPGVGVRGTTTQRSILAAALTVFAEHGFADTRVELITEAAGCSRPAFYQYFSGKEDVFWRLAGLLARELAELAGRLAHITADDDGVATLDAWLSELIDLYGRYESVFVAFAAASREGEPQQTLPRTITERFTQALDESSGFPADDTIDRDALAATIVAIILRSIHYWSSGIVDVERARFTKAIACTVHRTLFGLLPAINTGSPGEPPAELIPAWPPAFAPVDERQMRPRGLATRQTLLDAASRVLPQRGFHDTRVDDIVAEAGFSHGSFYRYFDNTDDLFRTVAVNAVDQLIELVDRLAESSFDGSLDDWLAQWFDAYRANGGVISAWQEIGFAETEMTAMSVDLALAFFDRLERIVHQRGFGDTAVDAVALLAILERVPYNVVVLGYLDKDEAIAAAGHLIRRGLLGAV